MKTSIYSTIFSIPVLVILFSIVVSTVYATQKIDFGDVTDPSIEHSTGNCPSGYAHNDLNGDGLEQNGECWKGVMLKDGNVGIATPDPKAPLHITSIGTNIKLKGTWPGAVTWGIASTTNNGMGTFDISNFGDDTAGVVNSGIAIREDGKVGIGIVNPNGILHVKGAQTFGTLRVDTDNSNGGSIAGLIAGAWKWAIGTWGAMEPGSGSDLALQTESGLGIQFFTNGGSVNPRMTIASAGNVGIGTTNPLGKLDVNGSIYQRGTSLHADYVFSDDYKLESIEDHAKFMFKNKHLKAIPESKTDETGMEIVEVGSHRKGIVEELEIAHIYIEQLHNRSIEQQKIISSLLDKIKALEKKI